MSESQSVLAASVLVVDDLASNTALLERLFTRQGYHVRTASDGAAAIFAIEEAAPDLVILDVRMPDFDGFDVCRLIKEYPATRLTPVIMVTGQADRATRIQGIEAGADDFVRKPFDPQELSARVRSLLRLKRYTDELESAESVIMSLALTVEARDSFTEGHCQRLAEYATRIGAKLGLGDVEREALYRGGYLHDIGKIGIPDSILLKEGPLTHAEYEEMKRHTIIGENLCANLRSLTLVRKIVRHHHERLDGSGYPDGLRGDAIPLLAQIIGIVDTFDAITTSRPYRSALPVERAISDLRADSSRGLTSRDLVETFISIL
jgi:putative two-component system response regulator